VTVAGALAPLAASPRTAGLLSDFDGTLAPIVADPADARPLPAGVRALAALAPRLGLVAVVSGRPVTFLREHVPVPGVVLAGVYGLERLTGDGHIVTDHRAAAHVGEVAAAAAEAERRWPSLAVERKGSVAFTVHWRRAPQDAPGRDALESLAGEHGLRLSWGRQAAELLVPVRVDKGTVVASLLDDHPVSVAAAAGDDVGDVAAFDALADRAARQPAFRAVRVAVRSHESPQELLDAADAVVDSPAALAALLADLAAALSSRG
jgi:trehalose 6-phosphate phosphatase